MVRGAAVEGPGEVPTPNRAAEGAGARTPTPGGRLPPRRHLRAAGPASEGELPDVVFLSWQGRCRCVARLAKGADGAGEGDRPGGEAQEEVCCRPEEAHA